MEPRLGSRLTIMDVTWYPASVRETLAEEREASFWCSINGGMYNVH